jgi:integrase
MQAVPDVALPSFLDALGRRDPKYVLLVLYGIETGLRVSDILKLRAGRLKAFTRVLECKTGKARTCEISPGLLEQIEQYKISARLGPRDFFIPSRWYRKDKPLSRSQAWRVISECAAEVGIDVPIGAHSMRKSYARDVYRRTKDIKAVQSALGHKYVTTTLAYFVDFSKLDI